MTIPDNNPNNIPTPINLEIPAPFDMVPNAWQLGYYDGYTGSLDQRFWCSDSMLTKSEYRKGWRDAKEYMLLEFIVERLNRRRNRKNNRP